MIETVSFEASNGLIVTPASGPVEIRVLTMAQCLRASRPAGIEQIGTMTVRIHGDSPWEGYRVLWGPSAGPVRASVVPGLSLSGVTDILTWVMDAQWLARCQTGPGVWACTRW
jgi:hypothetical protein